MIHYQLQRKLWHWKENKAFRILVFLYGKKTSNLNHTIKMSIKLNTEMYTTNVGGSTCCMGNSWHLQNNNIISRYSINILEQIITSVVSLRCRRTQSNTFTTLWLSSKQLWNNFCQVKKSHITSFCSFSVTVKFRNETQSALCAYHFCFCNKGPDLFQ